MRDPITGWTIRWAKRFASWLGEFRRVHFPTRSEEMRRGYDFAKEQRLKGTSYEDVYQMSCTSQTFSGRGEPDAFDEGMKIALREERTFP